MTQLWNDLKDEIGGLIIIALLTVVPLAAILAVSSGG